MRLVGDEAAVDDCGRDCAEPDSEVDIDELENRLSPTTAPAGAEELTLEPELPFFK